MLQHDEKSFTGYGFCPECGARGVSREKRPNGNDKCEKGHTYPSKDAVDEKQKPIGYYGLNTPRNLLVNSLRASVVEVSSYPVPDNRLKRCADLMALSADILEAELKADKKVSTTVSGELGSVNINYSDIVEMLNLMRTVEGIDLIIDNYPKQFSKRLSKCMESINATVNAQRENFSARGN